MRHFSRKLSHKMVSVTSQRAVAGKSTHVLLCGRGFYVCCLMCAFLCALNCFVLSYACSYLCFHVCVCSYVPSHKRSVLWSHMCALICVLLCVLSSVCSRMCVFECALTGVLHMCGVMWSVRLSFVCCHMCAFRCVHADACFHMCVLICVLSIVCCPLCAFFICVLICVFLSSSQPLVSYPFDSPHCLGSFTGIRSETCCECRYCHLVKALVRKLQDSVKHETMESPISAMLRVFLVKPNMCLATTTREDLQGSAWKGHLAWMIFASDLREQAKTTTQFERIFRLGQLVFIQRSSSDNCKFIFTLHG